MIIHNHAIMIGQCEHQSSQRAHMQTQRRSCAVRAGRRLRQSKAAAPYYKPLSRALVKNAAKHACALLPERKIPSKLAENGTIPLLARIQLAIMQRQAKNHKYCKDYSQNTTRPQPGPVNQYRSTAHASSDQGIQLKSSSSCSTSS